MKKGSETSTIIESDSKFNLEAPRFISDLPIIDSKDACNLARELGLPLVTGDDDELDAHIGVYFCRGRSITPDDVRKNKKLIEEAKNLPRTTEEVLLYFSKKKSKKKRQLINYEQKKLSQVSSQLLKLELQALSLLGIDYPKNIRTVEDYFRWLADHESYFSQPPFKPDKKQMEAFKFGFLSKYSSLLGRMTFSANPMNEWNRSMSKMSVATLKQKTYHQQFFNYDSGHVRTGSYSYTDYAKNINKRTLLYHATSLRGALGIIIAGKMLTGPMLGSVSFSADGIFSLTYGDEPLDEKIAFIVSFETAQRALHATAFAETARSHELEVRSPVPVSTDIVVGAVPLYEEFFPNILKSGYAGDKTYGGKLLHEIKRNYFRNNTAFNEEQLQYILQKLQRIRTERQRKKQILEKKSKFSKLFKSIFRS